MSLGEHQAAVTRRQRLLVLYACIGFILISSIEGTIVATVMPEIKSWTATSSLDDAFLKARAA